MSTRKICVGLGWLLLFLIAAMLLILFYPAFLHMTTSKAEQKANSAVAPYQVAIERCIQQNQGVLSDCHAGKNGIPDSYSSWVHTVRAIHVYQGVIRVSVKLDLGKKLFIYYIPKPAQRRWSSATTGSQQSLYWQSFESKYCGLDENTQSCEHFAKY